TGVQTCALPIFYSLSGWTVTRKSDTLFTVRPTYDVAERFTMAVIDNGTTTTENVQYDKKFNITVSDTNDAKFAAWAVKTSNNKYQIASYSKSYTFYACEAETYVVIINDGTDEAPVYKTVDGVTLNASNIDSEITETGSISTDEFITSKLKNKDPFVSVQRAQMTNLVDGKYRKARVYVRITQGCDSEHEPTSYGILYHQGTGSSVDEQMFINGTGTYRRAVTNKLESGQFTYTLSSKNGFNSDVTFRGYVNYDFTYSAGGTSATINGLDYSRIATATRS
ncbi:MAG: hypothetical protein IKF64_03330, partial [Eubacterium sp.]|nr:hypothetical protein [Eubacterium sp.]